VQQQEGQVEPAEFVYKSFHDDDDEEDDLKCFQEQVDENRPNIMI